MNAWIVLSNINKDTSGRAIPYDPAMHKDDYLIITDEDGKETKVVFTYIPGEFVGFDFRRNISAQLHNSIRHLGTYKLQSKIGTMESNVIEIKVLLPKSETQVKTSPDSGDKDQKAELQHESGSATNLFATYKDCFRFMADAQETSQVDETNLFKLAADSSIVRFRLEDKTNDVVLVIKLDYLDGLYSTMRGVQDNGLYFLFVQRTNGFEHVGTMEGNRYQWGTINGRSRFIVFAHMGCAEAMETEYVWNGKTFQVTRKGLYRYGQTEGEKELLKDYLEKKTGTESNVAPQLRVSPTKESEKIR
jgi:hypothetical protein